MAETVTSGAGSGSWPAVVAAVARRPSLWPTALRQGLTMVPSGWWREPPRRPTPPKDYLAFRQITATGQPDGPPRPQDVIDWLEWCRNYRRAT